jgi:hypothetical protein
MNARGHVGELVRDALKVDEPADEPLALSDVRDRRDESGLRHPDRERADAGPEQVERAHRHLEARAHLAEHVVVWHEHAVEDTDAAFGPIDATVTARASGKMGGCTDSSLWLS